MSKKRKKIPLRIQADVLFNNDRTCCICNDKTKGVQIHHIDEDPSNNSLDNLAVVCTHHQDKIHKRGGITKGITPELVKKYKYSWEQSVRSKRIKDYKPLQSNSGLEKILFEFEIRKVAHELNSLDDKDTKQINEKLEFLYTIHLLEGYTTQVLKAIQNIIIYTSMGDKNKTSIIAERMHHFCWHLADPECVPIDKSDIENIKLIIDILGTIGDFSGQFNKNLKTIKKISESFDFILNLSIWYNREDIASLAVREVKKIKKACKTFFEDEKPLTSGVKELNILLTDFKKSAKKEKIKWIDNLKI